MTEILRMMSKGDNDWDMYVGHVLWVYNATLQKSIEPAKYPPISTEGRKAPIYKTNVAVIYHSLLEDYGFAGLKRLQGTLGIKPMGNSKYSRHLRYLYDKMDTYFQMKQEKIFENIRTYYRKYMGIVPDENGILNIDVSYDGTWMKRGHVSNVVMNKVCKACAAKTTELKEMKITEDFNVWRTLHDEDCNINYEGTSEGMETEGAIRMFSRLQDLGFHYATFVGDGDSSAYNSVLAMNGGNGPYENLKVAKIECINHIKKRMTNRTKRLREDEKEERVTRTGKRRKFSALSGKNKLSDTNIRGHND
ncbi:uncharacterized protein LOC135224248 [Macrobrachium nipponense]|uniref:uncharacterized protein LOC135224248 n=1 Tax=Macrobrachium nipponense TaxID=159736 RepID=UPI0030C884AE